MTINDIKLVPNNHGGWLVIGDTERFGIQEVLYESPFIAECFGYLKKNGYKGWDVITLIDGKRKSHYIIIKKNQTGSDAMFYFDLEYGEYEGEVLEIVPI